MIESPPAIHGSQLLKLLVCASLSLQCQAWLTGGPNKQAREAPVQVNRRDALASVGFSALTFLAPPSFAEEATSALGEVEVVAVGESKKVSAAQEWTFYMLLISCRSNIYYFLWPLLAIQ
jgi:hypothetical protein